MRVLTVAGSHWLREDAGLAYVRARSGGCPAGITSSTRTWPAQMLLYRNQGTPGWPALADHPDRSKHVWRPDDPLDTGARALDLPEPARAWMAANGHRFGWIRTIMPAEPWHFEYHPDRDPYTLPQLLRGDVMSGQPVRLKRGDDFIFCAVQTGAFVPIPDVATNDALGVGLGGRIVEVDARSYNLLRDHCIRVRQQLRAG